MSEAEAKRKAVESFNDHQKDNRNRATQLANYAFILAGGSFTASVTVFASQPKEQITAAITHFLHASWYNLFLAMVAFFTMLTVMVIRDYFIAEARVGRMSVALSGACDLSTHALRPH
ncbi:MAG: hypothetical protein HOP04_15040 [Methylophilaceae bacterium]|nr:hypothetical protein [Methylophilaceae bacterium]